tara:strand:+ start:24321 stop:25103 length:783 start_codon:yes stop_codon:yes gene_type:complete
MEIPEIGTNDINIRSLNIPEIRSYSWIESIPKAIPIYPPVTQELGTPIINIPGCVEAHELDDGKNENLKSDDPKGAKVYCDAALPSFSPIEYNKEKLQFQLPAVEAPKFENESPDLSVPETKVPKVDSPECPTRAQVLKNPIGKILEGNKKIVAYELVGKECIEVTEKLNITDQIIQNIPSPGLIVTTGSIAAVAATSALLAKPLADLLLKIVKPAVKKTIGKIGSLFGRVPKRQSQKDRQDLQRLRTRALRELKRMKKR